MSFRRKTILGIALIEIILLLILISSGLSFLKSSNQDQLIQRSRITARLFAVSTKEAILTTDLASLESFLNEVLSHPEIVYARVIGDGIVLAQGGDPVALHRPFREDDRLESVQDGVFDIHADIHEGGRQFGRVEIGLSTQSIKKVLDDAVRWATAIAVVEVILVAVFSFALGTILTRELKKLKTASEEIAERGPGFQTEVAGSDEISGVARSFNRMSLQLERSYKELVDALEAYRQMAKIAASNEAKNKAILSATLDAIITINREGQIIEFNENAQKIFDYTPAEIIGASLVETLIPEEYRAAHQQGFARFLATGEGPALRQRLVVSALHRQGHVFPVELTISPIETEDALLFTAFLRDITEQQNTARELQLAAQALEADEGIFITDEHGQILRINQAFTRITGYSAEEALGKNPRMLSSKQHDETFYRAMWQRIEQDGSWRGEIYNKRKDGSVYPQSLSITAVKDTKDKATHYVAHFVDISERKKNEQSLKKARQLAEAANEAKSRFLATMSHEIRTPLNAIINMNTLLLESELSQEQRQFALAAVNGGQLLLALLNNVLDFSKIEAGKLTLDEHWFNPLKVVNTIAELFSGEAQNKGIEVVVIAARQVPAECFADGLRFKQILTNLLGNAIKFTNSGGVTVQLDYQVLHEAQSERLHLVVADTGIGIPEEQQAQLFGEFVQADSTATRRHQGTGLGLAISQRLVHLMGGEIECFSCRGEGARFSVDIPVRGRGKEGRHLDGVLEILEGVEVLVYSQSQLIRSSLCEQLSCYAITSKSFDYHEALERQFSGLDSRSRVVIILDTPMGISVMREMDYISALPRRYPQLRFVRLAPMSEVGAIDASKQMGFRSVVRKPAQASSLLRYLAVTLDASRRLPNPAESVAVEPLSGNLYVDPAQILLVEDSASNVAITRAALHQENYEITVAWNGQEALYAAEERKFDIILMDVSMPLMDGLEATQRIRQGRSLNNATPIIAMTANAFAEDRERCLNAGMDDFMSKPIDIRKLRSIVEYWLHQKAVTPEAKPVDEPEEASEETTSPAAEGPVFDPTVLDQLARDTSEELLPELAGIYLEETRKRIPTLHRLHLEENFCDLEMQAHSLKSGAGAFGVLRLQRLAFSLEQAARAADRSQLTALMGKLEEVAETGLRALEACLVKKTV
ncbi:MAG TPA: PAS domain S-box protein [Candidatus Competibacteraceae bacterium]|nr:PAS domain S-box protein [Candidatus Competibacteraceae bacterium]